MQLPNKYSDEFMDLLHQEDRRVWEFVYKDMLKVLLPIGAQAAGNVEEGRSLMQDCWINVLKVMRMQRFNTYEEFRNYCTRVMFNCCNNHKKRNKLKNEMDMYLEMFILDVLLLPDETDRRALMKVFLSLSQKNRKVLRLHYMDSLEMNQVSKIAGISERHAWRINSHFIKEITALKQVV